jgi:hypothetical protein
MNYELQSQLTHLANELRLAEAQYAAGKMRGDHDAMQSAAMLMMNVNRRIFLTQQQIDAENDGTIF